MTEIFKPLINEIIPSKDDVLISQGAKNIEGIPSALLDDLSLAMSLLRDNSYPISIIKECTKQNFEQIYFGEGNNAEDGILPSIVKNSEKLHLFAATIGTNVTNEINKNFESNEFPVGSFLDSGASLTADSIAKLLEMKINHNTTLSYSPGYCGWHVSGQKQLFKYLKPEKIGITLNESYLMTPLKSVSGVLVSGQSKIHIFDNNFTFCNDCKTYSCKSRMKSIINA